MGRCPGRLYSLDVCGHVGAWANCGGPDEGPTGSGSKTCQNLMFLVVSCWFSPWFCELLVMWFFGPFLRVFWGLFVWGVLKQIQVEINHFWERLYIPVDRDIVWKGFKPPTSLFVLPKV